MLYCNGDVEGSSRLGFPLSHHSLYFMLNFCNSFHEINFEMENFLKVNDGTKSGKS